VAEVWGWPRSARRRVERQRPQPITEEAAKIAACEIALDRSHRSDETRLAEMQQRFPTARSNADLAALEFTLAWAVKIYEDPALGEPAVRKVLEHHQRAGQLRSRWGAR
jgi:hypothetical protein